MTRVHVLVADDHVVVRAGLRSLLEADPDVCVVGEAEDGDAAVAAAAELQPDVVVMDVSMPGAGGAEATRRIRARWPAIRVVVLTAHEELAYLRQLLAAGASGYLLKRTAADELLRAVRRVALGETYLDPTLAAQATAELAGSGGASGGPELSEREAEVLRLIAEGFGNKQIAARLGLSVKTVETYKARAMEKLGLRSRAQLVQYALQRGWLRGD
ncbi:MAG: response regulator transcription factor [Myxococcales bacterium]|nr:response regulator transcription factor [Myxococcales bacterium]